MKKIISGILVLIALLSVSSCSRHLSPAFPTGTIPTPTYLNNGRLKSQSLDTFMGMTITAVADFYYDTSGKIMTQSGTVMGYPSGVSTVYSYTAAGKLAAIVRPAGSSSDSEYYTYGGGNKLLNRYCVDSTGVTNDGMTFTQDGSGLISRIDETQYGIPASYRLITRDARGFITREDMYAPGALTPTGYVTYTRNDSLKTITEQIFIMGITGFDIVLGYDSTGFLLSTTVNMFDFSGLTIFETITINNTLQSGPFDSGGANGYYYSDKDLFGILWMKASASGFSQ